MSAAASDDITLGCRHLLIGGYLALPSDQQAICRHLLLLEYTLKKKISKGAKTVVELLRMAINTIAVRE